MKKNLPDAFDSLKPDHETQKLYQVTATDDTGIRFVKYTGLTRDQAFCAKNEILYQVPRKLFNPRIRKSCQRKSTR